MEQQLIDLLQIASDIPYNSQRSSLMCPYCEGGRTKEYTLSVRRDYNAAYYQCHRASCDKHGVVKLSNSTVAAMSMKDPDPPSCYDKPLVKLPTKVKNWLASEWYITDEHIEKGQWLWAKQDNRIYMPILGRSRNKELGWVLRSIDGSTPKTLTFLIENHIPVVSFYGSRNTDGKVVIVEDIPSAVRISKYMHACALLGTNLSAAKIGEIKGWGMDSAILALDNDAKGKAAKLMPTLSSRFSSVKFLSHKLHVDIKNMTEEELVKLLEDK